MISAWQLIAISVLYIASLFFIAWYGDRRAAQQRPLHRSGLVYSLSLAVYCTSWTFYGAVGQAATNGWDFLAIYLGPIIFITIFWRMFGKIIRIAKEKRLTSIADFIATRYGRDQTLAVLVTLVAILGVIPYIALQLKAIATTFELATSVTPSQTLAAMPFWHDTAFYISAAMAVFVIIFGTRNIDASEQHPGMILAIAFESVIKLLALAIIGIWVMTSLYETPFAWISLGQQQLPDHVLFTSPLISVSFLLQTLLAGFAMLCLPRQFQVGIVENESVRHLRTARWLFPLYLVILMFFVIPIALSGDLFMRDLGFAPDTYVLSLPVSFERETLAIIAFIGGASAATGMIIVATIAISIMVSNEIILPALFHRSMSANEMQQSARIRTLVLTVRRLVIIAMMLASYLFYRAAGEFESLAAIGLLSFAVVAQFAPLLIGGLLWQGANRQGAMAGILAGTFVWFYTLMLPILTQTVAAMNDASSPLMGVDLDNFSVNVLLSLAVNLSCFIFFSVTTNTSVRERMLASDFTSTRIITNSPLDSHLSCKVDDIQVVLERILGSAKTQDFFRKYQALHGIQLSHSHASHTLIHEAETLLASVVGFSSAKVIFNTLLGGEQIQIRDLAFIASEASQAFAMSREQLQAVVENLQQGVSVVDRYLNLVAWNQRYLTLFDYPKALIKVGTPIEDIIRYNVQRGFCGEGDIERQVNRRMHFLRNGSAHHFEREMPNGTVISMQGHPMPDGGFVTSFTDITGYRRAQQALKEANITLERKVEASSQELDSLTSQLIAANTSKTRFLAATGHDLMQPLNAAKLFAATLAQQSLNNEQVTLLTHLEGALQSAEEVLSLLVEISKLDAGIMEPKIQPVSLRQVLKPLRDEFTALAADKGLSLTVRECDLWVTSDSHWLRRMIQNLLSNAVRYTDQGGILLGCRRRGDHLCIEVWDTGPGIPKSKLRDIFAEFKRLEHTKQDSNGLGLGLAIVERMAKKMNHQVSVDSWPGNGTRFQITLPLCQAPAQANQAHSSSNSIQVSSNHGDFSNVQAFCIDNDADVLAGMKALLSSWQCQVTACKNEDEAAQVPLPPDIMLADYQLDHEMTGLDVMNALRERFQQPKLPGILISADPRPEVAERARELGYYFLSKPVRPAALRALMRQLITAQKLTQ